MKKGMLFFIGLFLMAFNSGAQLPSFFLDSLATNCKASFSNDAIYIYDNTKLIKTDYQGNLKWSKQNVLQEIIVHDNLIFGISNDSIVRLDTSGAVIWVKKFSAPIYIPFGTQNGFYNIVYDGTFLYLHEMNSPPIPPPYPSGQIFHPTIIKMDTMGSVVSIHCDSVIPGHGTFQIGAATHSLQKGAIVSYGYQGGNYFYSFLTKVDSSGSFDINTNFQEIYFASVNYVRKIMPMHDGTYIVLSFSFYYMPIGNLAGFFTCTKISDAGNTIWQYSYYDNSFSGPGYQVCEPFGITCDSSNNIYVSGIYGGGYPFYSPFCTKIDPMGIAIATKVWSHSSTFSQIMDFKDIQYHNGNLYCLASFDSGYPAIIALDTMFGNTCFPSDTDIYFSNVSPFVTFGNHYHGQRNLQYTPVNESLTMIPQTIGSWDLCGALNQIASPHQRNDLALFPNPTKGQLTIGNKQLPINQIEIFNLLGEKVSRWNYAESKNEFTIDISDFIPGIYIIQTTSGEKTWRGKVVKE